MCWCPFPGRLPAAATCLFVTRSRPPPPPPPPKSDASDDEVEPEWGDVLVHLTIARAKVVHGTDEAHTIVSGAEVVRPPRPDPLLLAAAALEAGDDSSGTIDGLFWCSGIPFCTFYFL